MDEKLLQSLRGSPLEAEGIDGEEALKMIALMKQLEKINLPKLNEEKWESLSPIEQLVENLKQNKDVDRKIRKVKKKKTHWKMAKRKKREYDRTRYREVLKPQRKQALAERLTTAEGWWEYLNRNWRWLKTPVELTEQEWSEVLWPAIYPNVPVFFRYDTSLPIRLDNLVVKDTTSRAVLFDGKEWMMKQGGYVL